jgi:hypothetical protein
MMHLGFEYHGVGVPAVEPLETKSAVPARQRS